MIAKIRITTEEEAKAALAERTRLAREQAEREAELERQRQVYTIYKNNLILDQFSFYICRFMYNDFRRRKKHV